MSGFMTSRRLEALTHGWRGTDKIVGRLAARSPLGAGREENKQAGAAQGWAEAPGGHMGVATCCDDAKFKPGEKTGSHLVSGATLSQR